MKTKGFNLLSWAALSLVLVLLDQYTKLLAVAHLKGKTPLVILDGVFELLYSENRGAAFGILQGQKVFFVLITLVFLFLVFWIYPDRSRCAGGGHLCDVAHAGLELSAVYRASHLHHPDHGWRAWKHGRPYHTGLRGRLFILQADRFPDL